MVGWSQPYSYRIVPGRQKTRFVPVGSMTRIGSKLGRHVLGRKVHPYGFRLGVIRDWRARWYAEGNNYADLLHEDMKIRRYIQGLGSKPVSRTWISSAPLTRFR